MPRSGPPRPGADVDDPVALGRDRHVMLDQNDRVAGIDETVDLFGEFLNVGRAGQSLARRECTASRRAAR